ncbi:hypothetical protein [Streptomyces sp. NBC_01589]|uniref:hypothetical protein n=1 Tax=unclassified Streptomyces TaxID=2593676 RepID=UPI0038655633
MTSTRALMIAVYSVAYFIAVYAGATALASGDALYAVGLFGTSTGLLLGIHREARHAARLVRIAATYRHSIQLRGPAHDLAPSSPACLPRRQQAPTADR